MVVLESCWSQLLTPGPLILLLLLHSSLADNLLLNASDGLEKLVLLNSPRDGEDEILRSVESLMILPDLLYGGGVPHVLQLAASQGVVPRVAWVDFLLDSSGGGGGVLGSLDLTVHHPGVVTRTVDVVNLRDEVFTSEVGKEEMVQVNREYLKEPVRKYSPPVYLLLPHPDTYPEVPAVYTV